ncbi:Cthe_2314 family HEPN domain-containing protein [Pseudoxanthomonas wuyuanensis]|uniref:Cthe_2314 family HEPN domain-containing protein n=1 Tax=Pseudoxanthomonas wuyuanensis TaxID=1073196 RepID=UPI0011413EB1|nr:Cthe_2314 family HEPN domain-containing protein [Pseudoxanthomonas wuyuanensis]
MKESKFVQLVFEDARASMNEDPGVLAPSDAAIDEYQFYRQGVGFHLAHALTWLDQLSFAVELLTNYDYSKKISASRADHLIYNIENYLVRVNAAYDRALQLVNSVFHLCVHEEHVTHGVIVTNTKVQHRPTVVAKLKALRKILDAYSQDRHTIIHKHSLLDAKMRRIELFYQDAILDAMPAEKRANLKAFRATYLREFVVAKKQEFSNFNAKLALAVQDLFDVLAVEYTFQKAQFKARGF